MANVLIVAAHTIPAISEANKRIVKELQVQFPDAQVDDLVVNYPDFNVDPVKEQERLLWADVVIVQSPLFWFSMTSLVKRWFETAWAPGFAFGPGGDKMKGKKLIIGITAAGLEADYSAGGKMGIRVEDIVKPIKNAAAFTGMEFCGSVFTGGLVNAGDHNADYVAQATKAAKEHAASIAALIK